MKYTIITTKINRLTYSRFCEKNSFCVPNPHFHMEMTHTIVPAIVQEMNIQFPANVLIDYTSSMVLSLCSSPLSIPLLPDTSVGSIVFLYLLFRHSPSLFQQYTLYNVLPVSMLPAAISASVSLILSLCSFSRVSHFRSVSPVQEYFPHLQGILYTILLFFPLSGVFALDPRFLILLLVLFAVLNLCRRAILLNRLVKLGMFGIDTIPLTSFSSFSVKSQRSNQERSHQRLQ